MEISQSTVTLRPLPNFMVFDTFMVWLILVLSLITETSGNEGFATVTPSAGSNILISTATSPLVLPLITASSGAESTVTIRAFEDVFTFTAL